VALLATEALSFYDCHALQAYALQRFFDVVQFERFDYGFDLFHVGAPNSARFKYGSLGRLALTRKVGTQR
jgi:hypothetical protein